LLLLCAQPMANNTVKSRLVERVHRDCGDSTIVSIEMYSSETDIQQPDHPANTVRDTHRC